MNKTILTLLLSFIYASSCVAADIAGDIRQGLVEPQSDNGGFFEIGLMLGYSDPARYFDRDNEGAIGGFVLSGDYRYKGFFIEAHNGTNDGLNLGYNIKNYQNWSFDLLAASAIGHIDNDNEKDYLSLSKLTDDEKRAHLDNRDTLYTGAGLRVTGYFNNLVLQLRLITDTYNGNGIINTIRLGRNWQYRNWNFHTLASIEYQSKETTQYLYGIKAEESTTDFAEYHPSSSINYAFETGLTYPVSEDWVLRSFVRYKALDNEIYKSPLIKSDHEILFINTINYVF